MTPDKICSEQDYYVQAGLHSDPFTNSAAFDGWDLDYTQLSSGQYQCETREIRFSGLQIYTEAGTVTSNQRGTAWPNSYVFALPCSMEHEGRINGRRWDQEVFAFRGESEYDALVPPMKLLIVAVSRDSISEYMETVEHVSVKDWLKHGMLLVEDQAYRSRMAEAFTGVLDGCCADSSLLSHRQARSAVKQTTMEIIAPIISQNLNLPPIVYREFNRVQIVRRAREFLLDNITEPMQIIDVCREIGVSRRGLQYSFQDLLNINPVTYLRLLRLNGARRDLINAGEKPVQVKDVVARWGFWHLSRFSSEYKQIFNELPSETLRHANQLARSV